MRWFINFFENLCIPGCIFNKKHNACYGLRVKWESKIFCGIRLRICYITPWSTGLPEKLTGPHLVKKFPALYGPRMFITAFTRDRRLSLSWARSIQSVPTPSHFSKIILILSSHLRLGRPSGLLLSGFPTKANLDLQKRRAQTAYFNKSVRHPVEECASNVFK